MSGLQELMATSAPQTSISVFNMPFMFGNIFAFTATSPLQGFLAEFYAAPVVHAVVAYVFKS